MQNDLKQYFQKIEKDENEVYSFEFEELWKNINGKIKLPFLEK